jgi:hypothetical protein
VKGLPVFLPLERGQSNFLRPTNSSRRCPATKIGTVPHQAQHDELAPGHLAGLDRPLGRPVAALAHKTRWRKWWEEEGKNGDWL